MNLSFENRSTILMTLGKFEPSYVGIFGSYAREEEHSFSDLDILVEFQKKTNLLDLIGLEQELSSALKIPVDLVTKRSVSPYLKSFIERDIVRIL
ncbi:MAG: nucleotidyltransferase family protein [Bacteroidetes bacterium]|nr:nucleotidyltransferase family protein [Bacteroidota bacterium]